MSAIGVQSYSASVWRNKIAPLESRSANVYFCESAFAISCDHVLGSGSRVRIPHGHKWFAASVHKKRHGALGVILNNAEIIAIGFDWPGLDFPKSMACCEAHGILNPRIVPDLNSGIIPPIET